MLNRILICVCLGLLSLFPANLFAQEAKDTDIQRIMPVARVLTVIAPEVQPDETFTLPRPLLGIKSAIYDTNYTPKNETLQELTKGVISRHDVGCLEFTYKPLRMLMVDVPQPSGQMQRKVVTYLVYRVRNLGNHLTSKEVTEKVTDEFSYKGYQIVEADEISPQADIEHFTPHIVLEGWAEDFKNRKYVKKEYLETYLPYVVNQIEQVDRTPGKLHNWHSISEVTVDVTKDDNALGVWGVAVWQDVDPTINYFSVFVQGLTNAYRLTENADGTTVFKQKTLQLNFWRSGDEKSIEKDTIVNGIPLSKSLDEQAIYCRFYNLPGPSVSAYEMEVGTDRSMKLFEVDAEFDRQFNSLMLSDLQNGRLPDPVQAAFASLGINVPGGVALENKIQDIRWEFQFPGGDRTREFRVDHRDRYWVKRGKGVEILNRVENLWIYR